MVIMVENKEYKLRMEKHERELHEKYMVLYQDEHSYSELISYMKEFFDSRSPELKELDRKRGSSHGTEGTSGLFRHQGRTGMPYALRSFQYGKSLGSISSPGYQIAETPDGCDSQSSG